MKNKIHLCSFASNDIENSVKRFLYQAEKMGIYENIKIFRPADLSKDITYKIDKIIKKKGKYLYGHAIWKPYIVSEFLKKISKNDIIQYSDIGCHLNNKGIERFKDYIELTKKHKMLVFEYGNIPDELKKFDYNFQIFNEYHFTKGDVLDHFGLSLNSDISNSYHIWSGSFFLTKNQLSETVIELLNRSCNYLNLLDNSISNKKNHKDHIGMRGEQSLFSIICKLNNIKTISAGECEWAEGKDGSGRKWDHLNNYPILAKRDLKYGIFKRFFNRQIKNFLRIKRKIITN